MRQFTPEAAAAAIEQPQPRRAPNNSFRFFRAQESIDIPEASAIEFHNEFPGHELYDSRYWSVGLVSHHETRALISRSRRLGRIPVSNLAMRTLLKGRNSSWHPLTVEPSRLSYRRSAVDPDTFKISLSLHDPEGNLEAERQKYIKALRRLGKLSLPSVEWVPDITMGIVRPRESAAQEALGYLAAFIPDKIQLRRVYSHPNPFSTRNHLLKPKSSPEFLRDRRLDLIQTLGEQMLSSPSLQKP